MEIALCRNVPTSVNLLNKGKNHRIHDFFAGSLDHIHGRTESLSSEDMVPSREVPALLRDRYPFHSASAIVDPTSRYESSFHRNGSISYDIPQKSAPSQSYTGRQRSASPGSEMVTLEEFLEESNRLSPPSVSTSWCH